MSCGCTNRSSSRCVTTCTPCDTTSTECADICTALAVDNSWNIPACGSDAVLSVPGLTSVLIGAYVYNPTYGWYKVVGFNSTNGPITVRNECVEGNEAPGTTVPAGTTFAFSPPPSTVATSVTTDFVIPACAGSVMIEISGVPTVVVGSYIWAPTYGWLRVTAWDATNSLLTVVNDCTNGNAVAGTTVPSGTQYLFVGPPNASGVNDYFSQSAVGSVYTLTNASADVVFGTTSPVITLDTAGTYVIQAEVTFYSNGATNATPTSFLASLRRQNNTAADISSPVALAGIHVITTYTNYITTIPVYTLIYTTANTDDVIGIRAYYGGGAPSVGSFQVSNAKITAVRLFT
jgi:hypothetical protein